MNKTYVISATEFDTLKEAEEQINDWEKDKVYNEQSIVYEITNKVRRYTAITKLEEIK